MPKNYPKFEKVDAHTIKIIVEKTEAVPLVQLLNNKKQLLEQKKVIEETLKNINEILENATKLGITAEEKSKDVGKDLPSFIVDGICKNVGDVICNLGYACDGCPYNKDGKNKKEKN